jgi:hypothetical protein
MARTIGRAGGILCAWSQSLGGGGGDQSGVDPIIAGPLKRLPKSGENWPKAKRKLWLQRPEGGFDKIYEEAAA